MTDYRYCRVERDGHLLIVTIDRPQVHNALHPPAHLELEQIWDGFAADDDLWVGIITGAGAKAFCCGSDLKFMAAGHEKIANRSGFGGLASRFDLNKPLIAAVNGYAFGGGLEIALACDLVIADANAKFSFPEPKVGLMAAGGGVHRLVRMIPQKQALGMILTGRRVAAEEARMLGFVNEVVAAGEALAGARRWAARILECAPLAIRASKETVYRSLDAATLAEGIETDYPEYQRMLASEDALEGPQAFSEKRKPRWKNR